jgi:tetratricopeptide (TPR) repeat protein
VQDDANEDRNVIPRWHPLRATERSDLSSIRPASPQAFERNLERVRDEVRLLQGQEGIEVASDLFDSFILTGDRQTLRLAFKKIKDHKDDVPERLKEAILSVFRKDQSASSWRRQIASSEADENFVRNSIRVYKKQALEYPRDGLLHVEIARLYTILGVYHKAEYHLHLARVTCPNNRYALRSMMQFFDIVGDLGQGLKYIRNSEIIKFDPWIQSAEIAAATTLGRSSSIASHKLIQLDSRGDVPRSFSELAMAIATLDRLHGVKERKVFQLVSNALSHSTENGFAQAVWLSNRSTRVFVNRFPEAKPSDDAFEARVKLCVMEKDFEAAALNARLWVEDQPFSIDAIITYLNLRAIQVGPDEASHLYAKRALVVHSENWHVMNACVLLLAEAGDFENARAALLRMERQSSSEGISAFIAAARGFLAFAEGNFQLGRVSYEEAIRISRSTKNNYLIMNALIFWFRAETLNGLLTDEFIEKTSLIIEKSLRKIIHNEKTFLNDVWLSIKRRISLREWSDREKDGDAIAATVATYIDEPLLI